MTKIQNPKSKIKNKISMILEKFNLVVNSLTLRSCQLKLIFWDSDSLEFRANS